jgi:hypothetical protein
VAEVALQQMSVVLEPVWIGGFDRVSDKPMQNLAPLQQQRFIPDLLRQRVLEGVLEVREKARLVQKLRRLQVREPSADVFLRQVCNGLQERQRHILSDHGGGLEKALVLGRQSVDARGEYGLRRRRDLPRVRRLRHSIGPPLAEEHRRLHEAPHALFQEERIPLGTLDQHPLERLESPVLTQQGVE